MSGAIPLLPLHAFIPCTRTALPSPISNANDTTIVAIRSRHTTVHVTSGTARIRESEVQGARRLTEYCYNGLGMCVAQAVAMWNNRRRCVNLRSLGLHAL